MTKRGNPEGLSAKRGRPIKYDNDEDRKAAIRASKLKYIHRIRAIKKSVLIDSSEHLPKSHESRNSPP